MSDDWGWYFTSAERRTTLLRDELDAANAMAAAQSTRLSSQLRTLQGSIESRLNALSAAFDAYVELGDIREQLAGFPDTAMIRRDVAGAVDALAQGREAVRVDDRGQAYWLPHAANAVIGLAIGKPDAEQDAMARSLSPQADLFVVAACGALGQGEAVADRLPSLLVCDDGLSADQLALWGGALDGRYGSGALPAIRAVWSSALDQANADVATWRTWIREQAKTRDVEVILDWVGRLLGTGGQPPPAVQNAGDLTATASADTATSAGTAIGAGSATRAPDDGSAAALRAVVGRLVVQGTDREAPLLSRARELRERIENPGRIQEPDTADELGTPVAELVRRTVLGTRPESPERAELVSWIAPALRAAAEAEAITLGAEGLIVEQVRTPDGIIEVGSSGPGAPQVERARAGIATRYPTSPMVGGALGGIAALLLVLTVVLVATGSGWGFLTALLMTAAGVAAIRAEVQRRGRITAADDAATRLDSGIADAQRRVDARIDARETARTAAAAAIERIRTTVPEPGPPAPQADA